jgi:hypothetical protein
MQETSECCERNYCHDVNELTNTGQAVAEFVEGSDRYRIVFDRFAAKAPFQDGGIATRIYEHGDSGNGDPLYPKTWLYLGAWGIATMWKNDQVLRIMMPICDERCIKT